MENRPKLQVTLTRFDKALELIGLSALIFMWGLAIYYFFTLPNTIPVHFNASGQPDSYGAKGTIFILPATGLFIFIIMTLLNKYPQAFNYPVKITAANALRQYANGTRTIRYIKTAVLVVFTFMLLFTGSTATGKTNGLGLWFLPLTLAFICIPVAYFIIKSFTIAK